MKRRDPPPTAAQVREQRAGAHALFSGKECTKCKGRGKLRGTYVFVKCTHCKGSGIEPGTGSDSAIAKYGPAVEPKPRKRNVQHERREMEALWLAILYGPEDRNPVAPWWSPGFTRWEARTANDGETLQNWREGAQSGWPDAGLFVPAYHANKPDVNPDALFVICAVVEMKAPDVPHKGATGQWWLEPWVEGRQSRYGLREDQARWLRLLHGCGFATLVAYEWREAYGWLDQLAGPKPEVLPW